MELSHQGIEVVNEITDVEILDKESLKNCSEEVEAIIPEGMRTVDPVLMYLLEIRKTPLLTPEEEIELAHKNGSRRQKSQAASS